MTMLDTDTLPEVITISWCIDDVQNVRPDLTNDQARKVLSACNKYHDANVGINWSVIECHADMLFPEPE